MIKPKNLWNTRVTVIVILDSVLETVPKLMVKKRLAHSEIGG